MIKIFLLFLFPILASSAVVHAQDRKLDSLDQLIAKAKTDTDRIKLNIDKINLLARSDLNAAIALGKSQLENAEKINFYKGIVKLRSQLSSNFIFTGEYEKALENIHFLEKYIKPEDSINYSGIIATYGMMYGVKGVYDSSILYYTKAIDLNERLHNNIELAGNYTNIAIGYQQLANYPMALKYQQKALALSQKDGNQSLEAKTLLNMGITYQNIGDTDRAVKTYQRSVDMARLVNSRIVELYGYSNLATLYLGKQEYTKAYDLAIKAADLAAKSGDKGIQAASLSKAATSLAYQHKFEEATALSNQAISMADSSSQPMNISQAFNAMAITLFLQKKYTEAIPYFEKTINILPGAAVYDMAYGEAYKLLSVCYEKTGNYKKALENYRLGVDINDSMRRKDNIRKATELSMNYDFQKREEVQKAEQKLKDSITRSKQNVLIAALGIFLLLSILAFIGYKNKQKAMALLKEQKQQIESTLSQLKSTQAQLVQSEKMASLGELTAGIAHEIQNPLNFVNNFSELNREMVSEALEEVEKGNLDTAKEILSDIKENSEKINHHGRRADSIVKGMLQHSRSSTGKKEPADINALCDEYVRLSYHGLRAKDKSFNAEIKTDFDPRLSAVASDQGKINIVPQDIGRVILNLLNNAFYAVNDKMRMTEGNGSDVYVPRVTVATQKLDDKIFIKVADNGNGIPQRIKDKIFQPFFTTKPTGQGTGLGLSMSYDIVKSHGGELEVDSEEGKGTTFTVLLPVV